MPDKPPSHPSQKFRVIARRAARARMESNEWPDEEQTRPGVGARDQRRSSLSDYTEPVLQTAHTLPPNHRIWYLLAIVALVAFVLVMIGEGKIRFGVGMIEPPVARPSVVAGTVPVSGP